MIGIFILAAGESKRFGGLKLLVNLCGRPLISYSVEAALAAGVGSVYVVVGREAREIAAALRGVEVGVIYNPWFRQGLSSSLKAAVLSAPRLDGYVVALGDMPLVRPQTYRDLVKHLGEAPIIAPTYKGRRGNPVLLDRRALPHILTLEGDIGARALLGALRVSYVEVDDPGVLIDIDEPDDLAEASRAICNEY
ncbi:MAG: nucleotidyltransferase family protein [Thermoproteus sp. AZ2]|uniref:Nucleotidyltransferase family protein n=1 Tax=Thermoproteus sp. AZ2 TaxID=1609232 RepID=A0ACC6V046_9CREN|nr:MAG: 4-diphosphocytidyl-2C-methyl-D-erythritol kinase [Thermoproteus sp. AZ2]